MEAYASNAAIRRLKQEDCFGFKVSLRCIVKIQANLDCRMRPCPLKRPRTGPQSYSLRSSHVTQGPLLLPEGAAFLSNFHRFQGGVLRRSSLSSPSSLTPSQSEMQKGDPSLLVWAQELNESWRRLVTPPLKKKKKKNRSKKFNMHQAR